MSAPPRRHDAAIRQKRLYFEEVDDALSARVPLIKYIFRRYSGKYAMPSDTKFMMSLDEWMTFVDDVRLGAVRGFAWMREATLLLCRLASLDRGTRSVKRRRSSCFRTWPWYVRR